MHTRQGVAEPAQTQHTLSASHPHHIAAMAELGDPIVIYSLANVLGHGPNRSCRRRRRVAVGPRWLESLITIYVEIDLLPFAAELVVFVLGVALVAIGVAVLLVGER